MTTSLLVDGSSPDKCERRRANSDTPATPAPTSSIPEWRKEGLGEELIEALERIERDSPQTHEPVKPKPRNLGSWLFGDSRAHRAKHWSSKDERKAEKRREKERAEPEVCSQISTISAPYEVTHSLYLQGSEALLGEGKP